MSSVNIVHAAKKKMKQNLTLITLNKNIGLIVFLYF